jgi:hypothetical protein
VFRAWSVWTSSWHQDVATLLPKIWEPFLHNVSDPHFVTDESNKEYNIPDKNHKWARGEKKILIIDVDSRLDLSEGAILNKKPLDKTTIKGRTAGILNHFLYGESPTKCLG